MHHLKYSSLAIAIALLSACSSETTESNNVKTEAIWSDIYVTSNGQDSRVIAELNVSSRNGNNLKLTNGDKLQATVGTTVKTLEEDDGFFDIDYRAVFDVAVGDTKFVVQLNRASENKTLTNTITLPPQYQILAPQTGQLYDKDDSIEIEWTKSGAGDQFSIVFNTECTKKDGDKLTGSEVYNNVSDDGDFTINLSNVEFFNDALINTQHDCTGSLTFERRRHGQIDPAYVSGSRTYAAQQRSLDNIIISL
ncbi:hypothetical protein J8L98_03185 [Pseudoalteromonas sp. MMG013]|uniref:hypothetical protein n=1 Tax=unclassified Pseudoalteromonas TaxID=194690 RepID=UPI001B38BB52|nr:MULTISPECIES: hypothetical protein [unclassified Pseudoalteromonas]MBQ4845424.1 hypothetical protein [Pseudoalteromonas sp. MMG005]MBQ4850221.1 hypothetical protein [Pseudoalteromonas sp. MMG012]MBQ4860699.1 hypothetical protein [Pseudoalteromonas sp. MMG013]